MHTVFINVVSLSFIISIFIILFKILSPVFQKISGAGVKQFIWIMLALRLALPVAFTDFNYEITTKNNSGTEQMLIEFENDSYPSLYINKKNSFYTYQLSKKYIYSTEDEKTDVLQKLIGKFADWYYLDEDTITGVYFIGVFIFLFSHMLTYFFLKCKLDLYSREVFTEVDKSILAKLAGEIGVDKVPDVYFSGNTRGPMVVGVLQPVIYIPDMEYTEEELKSIFRHELMHIKHKDLWLKKLYLLVNAIHWFNPFCYFLANAAGKDMELYCDEQVVKKYSLEERNQYNRILLKFAELGSKRNHGEKYFSTDYLGNVTEMKKRFKNNISMKTKGFGIPILVVCLILCMSVSENVLAQVRTDKGIFYITEYNALRDYYYNIFMAQNSVRQELSYLSKEPDISIYCNGNEIKIKDYDSQINYDENNSIITNEADEFFAKMVKKEVPLFELWGDSDSCYINITFPNGEVPKEVVIEDMVLDENGYVKSNNGIRYSEFRDVNIDSNDKYVSFYIKNHEAVKKFEDSVDLVDKLSQPVIRGIYMTCYWQDDGSVRYRFVVKTRDCSYDYLLQQ